MHYTLNLLLYKITGVARRESGLHAKKCDSIIPLHNIGESLFASCWSIAIFNGLILLTVCVYTERTYTVVIVVFLLFGLTVNGASFGI